MSWRAFTATWAAIVLMWWVGFALHSEGPFVEIGHWLNRRAARKTLRLLHAVAFWAAEPELCE